MNTTSKSGTKTEEPIPTYYERNKESIADYCYRVADAMLKERELHIAK